jgi:hypothetical protein
MYITTKQSVTSEEDVVEASFEKACDAIQNRLNDYKKKGHIQNIKLNKQGNWMEATYDAVIPGFCITVALKVLSHSDEATKISSQITVNRTMGSFGKN